MTVKGPDFIALQVRDLQRAADFYETKLGLRRSLGAPPHAVVFDTHPIPFAVREPMPGVDLDIAAPQVGFGIALWLHCDAVQELHDSLVAAKVVILSEPKHGPFGLFFTFQDLDGYAVTIHGSA